MTSQNASYIAKNASAATADATATGMVREAAGRRYSGESSVTVVRVPASMWADTVWPTLYYAAWGVLSVEMCQSYSNECSFKTQISFSVNIV